MRARHVLERRPLPGDRGAATPTLFTNDTGYFWFFDNTNVELVVKVLDARVLNGQFWVFASGLTNVGVDITVVDTVTGSVKTYQNPLNTAFQAIQDTAGFPPPTPNVNIDGVWEGTAVTPSGSASLSFTLSQTGSAITGTTVIQGGGSGSLTGSLLGRTFTYTVTEPPPCGGTTTGSSVVDDTGRHMTGSFMGTDCEGTFSGTMTVTKR